MFDSETMLCGFEICTGSAHR